MKGRKKEKHNELVNEVIKQINSFKPEPSMIKNQIEWLIESDYLMRDKNDRYSSLLMFIELYTYTSLNTPSFTITFQ